MHGIGLGTEKLTNKREKKKRPPTDPYIWKHIWQRWQYITVKKKGENGAISQTMESNEIAFLPHTTIYKNQQVFVSLGGKILKHLEEKHRRML